MCANLAFYKDLLRSSEDILDGKLDVSFFFFFFFFLLRSVGQKIQEWNQELLKKLL